MLKCSFSGKEIPKGTGRMVVRNSGRVYYFLDHKALKNFMKLGRKPQKTKWTVAARKLKAQRVDQKSK